MMDGATLMESAARVGLATLLHATVLGALTWALCRTLLRRRSPSVHAFLWTVVLVKFAAPPILPGEVGLSGWLASWGSGGASVEGAPLRFLSAESVHAASPERGWVGEEEADAPQVLASGTLTPLERLSWRHVLWGGYVGVVVFLALRWAEKRYRMNRYLARLPLAPPADARRVEAWARRVKLFRAPETRMTSDGISPFVWGFRRPVLVLPEGVWERLAPEAREGLILHELAHLKRGDPLVRGLENAVRVVFFFWPPAWWVCRRIERFSELACDRWAMRWSRATPDVYAGSLLEVARSLTGRSAPRLAGLAFARQEHLLEERFKMILDSSSHPSWRRWVATPLLTAWVGFSLVGGTPADGQEKPQPPQVQPDRPEIDLDQPLPQERQDLLKERFGEQGIDADGDGVITRREAIRFFREHGTTVGRPPQPGERPVPNPQQAMMNVFDHFLRIETGRVPREMFLKTRPETDADGDGQLGDEEFHEALRQMREVARKRAVGALPSLDLDEDGALSDREVNAFIDQTLERVAHRVLNADPAADKNGDGELSREEYLDFRDVQQAKHRQAMLERFPQADLNEDGQLDEEEMKALESRMRQRGIEEQKRHRGPLPGERIPPRDPPEKPRPLDDDR